MAARTNVLVTGGAGYIGSHTALALQQAGFQPVVVDDLSTGNAFAAQKFGPFRQGNVGDRTFVEAVCDEFNPQALIHFAAFSLVGESVQLPQKYFTNNTDKARVLFDTVFRHGVKYVVFSSTAAAYGAVTHNRPITETDPTQPINPYGQSKLNTEEYLRSLDEKGMRSVALRYFNAAGAALFQYGIGEAHWPESHLIPNAILAATVEGRKLSVFGTDYPTPDRTAIRDYIHVIDLASAHLKAMQYLFDRGKSQVFNLGTGKGNSVLEVIAAVERSTGTTVNREFVPRREGDPSVLVADATKAGQLLNWQPEHNLQQIVDSAAVWHASRPYQTFVRQKLG
jgi:UDP-glucose-4-epimerase GalE